MKKTTLLFAALFALVAMPALAIELEVINKSKTPIQHLYMSDTGSSKWGDDQLGDDDEDIIEPGDSYTVTDIDPGRYDLKLVAKDGTECVINDQRIGADKSWTVTEQMLDSCGK